MYHNNRRGNAGSSAGPSGGPPRRGFGDNGNSSGSGFDRPRGDGNRPDGPSTQEKKPTSSNTTAPSNNEESSWRRK